MKPELSHERFPFLCLGKRPFVPKIPAGRTGGQSHVRGQRVSRERRREGPDSSEHKWADFRTRTRRETRPGQAGRRTSDAPEECLGRAAWCLESWFDVRCHWESHLTSGASTALVANRRTTPTLPGCQEDVVSCSVWMHLARSRGSVDVGPLAPTTSRGDSWVPRR